jgi:hypothetical protein
MIISIKVTVSEFHYDINEVVTTMEKEVKIYFE